LAFCVLACDILCYLHILTPTGLYFVVRWLDDGDDVIFDTLSSKDTVSPEGVDVLNLSSGDKCSALFKGLEYPVEIIACGELLIGNVVFQV